MRRILAALILLAGSTLGAQQPFDLSVRNIMRGPELYGREPNQVRFTADGQWIYFRWLQAGAKWNEETKPFRVAARAGAVPEPVTDAQMDSVAPMLTTGRRSRDGRTDVLAANGDLYLRLRRPTMTHRRITQTNGIEADPRFSLDEREILFIRDNNIYAFEIASGLTRQLTDIRSGAAPKEPDAPKGQRATLAEQQRLLLEVIRDEIAAESLQAAQRRATESRRLPVVEYRRILELFDRTIGPNGSKARR